MANRAEKNINSLDSQMIVPMAVIDGRLLIEAGACSAVPTTATGGILAR
jgi:hypothetical protein